MSRAVLVLGLAGGTFFMIGGSAAAVAAVLLVSLPGIAVGILARPGSEETDFTTTPSGAGVTASEEWATTT